MSWLFKTEERKDRQREEEEKNWKSDEAARMLADLFIRHYSLANAAIIAELERIHQFYAVPSWAPSGDRGGYFCEIARDLTRAPLPLDETGRLAAMLLWPELREYKDRNAPSCFVSAVMQNPSAKYIPALAEHLAWLEDELKHLTSSQYRNDVASELRLTKSAVQACRLKP
jgi:hypothetical protein